MKTAAQIFIISVIIIGCAHHRDVRPGDRGIHRVVAQAYDTEEGSRNAISQAKNYCEQFEKRPHSSTNTTHTPATSKKEPTKA